MSVASSEFNFRGWSLAERLQLVQDLWDEIALETDELPVPDGLEEELERRKAEHLANPSTELTWQEAKAQILKGDMGLVSSFAPRQFVKFPVQGSGTKPDRQVWETSSYHKSMLQSKVSYPTLWDRVSSFTPTVVPLSNDFPMRFITSSQTRKSSSIV